MNATDLTMLEAVGIGLTTGRCWHGRNTSVTMYDDQGYRVALVAAGPHLIARIIDTKRDPYSAIYANPLMVPCMERKRIAVLHAMFNGTYALGLL